MAQVSRSTLAASITTLLADNTTGDITAADLRSVLTDLEDSAGWYDEAPSFGMARRASVSGLTWTAQNSGSPVLSAVSGTKYVIDHSGNNGVSFGHVAVTAGADFTRYIKTRALQDFANNISMAGVFVGNSAAGPNRRIGVGFFGTELLFRQYWTGTTFGSEVAMTTQMLLSFQVMHEFWWRIVRSGNTLTFGISIDGFYFIDLSPTFNIPTDNTLTDIDHVGIYQNTTSGTANRRSLLMCEYLSATVPVA